MGLYHVLLNENHKRVMDEEAMDYVMCKCGMAFAARYFDEETVRQFYELGDYRYSTAVGSREVEDANINEETERANLIMPVITKYLPICKSALDVGCSTGILLERIQKHYKNCVVTGIEPSEKFRDFVQSKENIYKCLNDIQDLNTVHKETGAFYIYSLITAIHLLEHLIDPLTMLGEIVKRLARGGVFICEVPPFQMMLGHPMLFTETTLAAMLGVAGFNDINFEKSKHITAVARIVKI
jgi:2-polyprenyl-3-methyl-5-hydroxy-6-metoxy-1,4-benzoquinol methylase